MLAHTKLVPKVWRHLFNRHKFGHVMRAEDLHPDCAVVDQDVD